MTVSIIIAVRTWQKNLEKCVAKCQELNYPDFEIIVLPDSSRDSPLQGQSSRDSPFQGQSSRDSPFQGQSLVRNGVVPIKVIPTGSVSPPRKRDMAIDYAKGEIFAFIDDDAYPAKDWLKNAIRNFADPIIAAVGGPAITAPDDNLRQKVSGIIYSSFLGSGRNIYRYLPKDKREVDDYPSCNFLVRKSVMQELGGFKTNFWPGEDSKLCFDITQSLNKKIIYDPEVLVYHHRRPLFIPHLKQVANYALHRGYFVKRYPQTSFRISYFVPTLFLGVVITGGILSIFLAWLRIIYLWGISLYFLLVFIFSICKDLRLIPLVFFGIILTHLTYGFYFLKGLFSMKLSEER